MFSLNNPSFTNDFMQALAKKVGGDEIVVGLGLSLIQHLDGNIEGLKVLTTQVANELKFLRCLPHYAAGCAMMIGVNSYTKQESRNGWL